MKKRDLIAILAGLAATLTAIVTFLSGGLDNAPPTTTTASSTPTTIQTPTTVADTTTTSAPETINASKETPCYEWLPLAVAQGWTNTPEILEQLGAIIWREARCLPGVISATNDHGLTQINADTHRAYVETVFGEPFEDAMSDPAKNLRFAWILYSGREAESRCGWTPWSVSC